MTEEINKYLGVTEDNRSQIDKDKDYKHEEAVMSIPLNWNRGIEGAPLYSLRDQDGSGSCVGQSVAKALEILNNGEVESAHPTYRRRANYPGIGMWLADAGFIIRHKGTTTELLDPSQRMSEVQMNAEITVETPINGYLYIFPDVKNIDEIATAIELQKHCIITINGTIQEYANSEKPIVTPGTLNCSHAICGVYYFTDENGVKCILIDESWGPNYIKRRVLTEDYLRSRGTGAMYFIPPVPNPESEKPKFEFKTVLLYGQSNNSIKNLQDILKYEGLFPKNIDSTGKYFSITAKAVLAWQIKHNVAPMAELNSLQGKRVGEKTIKALNLIYNK